MNMQYDEQRKKIDYERIEESRKRLAHILNVTESVIMDIDYACNGQKWNNEIVYQLKDAACELGFALATLTNWFNEDKKDD